MFKNLYYYDSYQPLDVKVDSAIHTPYNDAKILNYSLNIKELREKTTKFGEQQERALDMLRVIGGERYHREFNAWGDSLITSMKKSISYDDSIRLLGRRITPEFMGWAATHKYCYKEKSGTIDTTSQVFIMDNDFTKIINVINIEDDSYDDCQQIIKKILERQ